MSIIYDKITIPNTANIKYNNINLTKIRYNNVTVWERVSASSQITLNTISTEYQQPSNQLIPFSSAASNSGTAFIYSSNGIYVKHDTRMTISASCYSISRNDAWQQCYLYILKNGSTVTYTSTEIEGTNKVSGYTLCKASCTIDAKAGDLIRVMVTGTTNQSVHGSLGWIYSKSFSLSATGSN